MFTEIRNKMQLQFNKIQETGNLFYVDVDKSIVWETYLAAFPEQYRQENTCNCCKSFIRQYANIVGIDSNNQMITLWDFETEDPEYKDAVLALGNYVRSKSIAGIFRNGFQKCGTDKNLDAVKNIVWNHFYIELPKTFVIKDSGPVEATALDNKNVLMRSLQEITEDATNTVIELINQNSLYRGNEFIGMVKEFQKVQTEYRKIKQPNKSNYCWHKSGTVSQAITRIKNSSIGTLLMDLSEGKELDKAVAAFERVVAPANYKRPTALVTPRMIEDAQKRLNELGLVECLNRRLLSDRDLTVNNTIFVDRPNHNYINIFDQLKKETQVHPKSLTKVEEISIQDFVSKVLPTSKTVKVLVENTHLNNFVSLVGPAHESDETLFKWKNNYSWSYSGEVADSIKDRVKNAGGKVDGVLRVSLSWHNTDDLDLHLIEPDHYRISFQNKGQLSPSGGKLDVDMNAPYATLTRNAVENITYAREPKKEGTYKVIVNNYNKRESTNEGFEVELEFDGQIHNFTFNKNGPSGRDTTVVQFNYSKKDGVTFVGQNNTDSKYPTKDKWGIATGQFHKVRAITLSPNYWNAEIGNKHYFFFLEKCVSDEKTRGFYNEFLKEELSKDRKVFEILGNKITVEPTENELSGIGFSDTIRNHLFVEIEGNFTRTLKIKF